MYGSLQCYMYVIQVSHADCVIVEPVATMYVQNYAGSRVKSDSCWKCCSGWHTICLHYSYNSSQHFNWHRASRRSLGDSWAPPVSKSCWCSVLILWAVVLRFVLINSCQLLHWSSYVCTLVVVIRMQIGYFPYAYVREIDNWRTEKMCCSFLVLSDSGIINVTLCLETTQCARHNCF